ncbi:MAG TPA: tetratricopeptide repeat protein [Chitinophagaceae bacterium]|nr:tetratricopeptide repeat protein [Chitinophagaceae bacterium]
MKTKLLGITLLAFTAACIVAFRTNDQARSIPLSSKKKLVIRCGPDWDALKDWLEESDIPPMPGAGNYKWKISTKSDSAQFYFNQGINMYYGFHIIEAMASFKKAQKFDLNCGMLHWAEALAYGPNINDLGYAAAPDALKAAGWAIESSGATEKEEALIWAQRARYTGDSTESRETRDSLNQVYTDLMKVAYDAYPNDPDVATLYADALMLQHPWDLWNNDGTPKPWTPLIRQVLEKVLAKTPNHPGANHYYIHVMEASPYADKALASADRLGRLSPGLSHIVHMPSHIYLREGQYDKGISVNLAAVKSYEKYIPLFPAVAGSNFLYSIHNLHMQTNHAMLAGRLAASRLYAQQTQESIPAEYLGIPGALGNTIQYIYMTPALVNVRFGEWGTILEGPQPKNELSYASALYHFAMGMAKSAQSRVDDAKEELKEMEHYMKDSVLLIPLSPFSAAIEAANVARDMLAGAIAMKENKFEDAIALFKEAVAMEESMVYDEPRDWLLNPKHWLANAYIKAGEYDNAEKTLQADLRNNKENGWALFGLYQALKAQKKTVDAAKMLARFKKALSKAAVKLYGPVF